MGDLGVRSDHTETSQRGAEGCSARNQDVEQRKALMGVFSIWLLSCSSVLRIQTDAPPTANRMWMDDGASRNEQLMAGQASVTEDDPGRPGRLPTDV